MSSRLEMPLHSKSDGYMLPVCVAMFMGLPLYLLITGELISSLGLGAFLGLFCWWFFGRSLGVIGRVAVVTAGGLALEHNGHEIWSVRWSDITSITVPEKIGPPETWKVDTSGRVGQLELEHLLMGPKRQELVQAITPHLTSGVSITRRVQGLHGSRARYLGIGLICLLLGVIGLIGMYQLVSQTSGPEAQWKRVSSVFAICGLMALLAVGIVNLLTYIAWKPELVGRKSLPHSPEQSTLFAALQLPANGEGQSRFAYATKFRKMNLERQIRNGWLVVVPFCLFLAWSIVAIHWEKPRPGEQAPSLGGLLFVDAMAVVVISLMLVGTAYWAKHLRRLIPAQQLELVLQSGKLFVQEESRLISARVVSGPALTTYTRDSSGLNSAWMEIEVRGEHYWIDPMNFVTAKPDAP